MNQLSLETTLEFQRLFSERASVQKSIEEKRAEFEAQTKEFQEKLQEIDKKLTELGFVVAARENQLARASGKNSKEKIIEALMKNGTNGLTVPALGRLTGLKTQNISAWLYVN